MLPNGCRPVLSSTRICANLKRKAIKTNLIATQKFAIKKTQKKFSLINVYTFLASIISYLFLVIATYALHLLLHCLPLFSTQAHTHTQTNTQIKRTARLEPKIFGWASQERQRKGEQTGAYSGLHEQKRERAGSGAQSRFISTVFELLVILA